MNTAPVVLFAYNRPCHVAKVIEALQKNELARDTDLICYADGAKSEQDAEAVRQVRAVLREISGFRSVRVIERPVNMGLADSIVQGVTEVVNDHGRVIVLEDDIVTSPFFLRYMNDALERYANEDKVMHVAAYIPKIDFLNVPETFFLRHASCWGWGTWKRAWQFFHRDDSRYINSFSAMDIQRFNIDDIYDYWGQILANHTGKIKTWAVYWYASIFDKNGLSLHPYKSLVINIGFDKSGTNCSDIDPYETIISDRRINYFSDVIEENKLVLTAYKGNITPPKGIFFHIFKKMKKIYNFFKYGNLQL